MKQLIILSIFLCGTFLSATEPMYITTKKVKSEHSPKPKTLYILKNAHKEIQSKYYFADLEVKDVKLKGDILKFPRSPYGSFQALIVTSDNDEVYKSAVRYVYGHGKPSKVSPSKLTHMDKLPFEIIPNPLHREHNRYYSDKKYDFLLRFDGVALANQDIFVRIDNNDKKIATTDKNGAFFIKLDDTFTNVKADRKANKPKEFILYTKYNNNAKEYITSFTYIYNVNPTNYWRSIPAGLIVMALGMGFGLLLYRKIKKGKK